MTFEEELLTILNQIPGAIEKAFTAFVERHPGHASQKPHGRRYGAGGDLLPKGHKRGDAVKGGKSGGGGVKKEAPKKSYQTLRNDKEIRKHYDLKSKCKQNKSACEGISDYTYDDASVINNYLRRGEMRGDSSSVSYKNQLRNTKEAVDNLDKAFEIMPRVPEDIQVTRFVSSDVANMLNPGIEFQDKGFVSTTIKPDLEFESYDGNSDWKINIGVPKGSKGIYVKDKSVRPSENELLLPRGSQMKITGKDPKTKTVYAEYINGQ